MTSHREAHKTHAFTKLATYAYIKSVAPLQDCILNKAILIAKMAQLALISARVLMHEPQTTAD